MLVYQRVLVLYVLWDMKYHPIQPHSDLYHSQEFHPDKSLSQTALSKGNKHCVYRYSLEVQPPIFIGWFTRFTIFQVRIYHHPKGTTIFYHGGCPDWSKWFYLPPSWKNGNIFLWEMNEQLLPSLYKRWDLKLKDLKGIVMTGQPTPP